MQKETGQRLNRFSRCLFDAIRSMRLRFYSIPIYPFEAGGEGSSFFVPGRRRLSSKAELTPKARYVKVKNLVGPINKIRILNECKHSPRERAKGV